MTTSPIETERQIRHLDNDVQSIDEMLSAIAGTQTRHGSGLGEHAEKLDAIDARLGGVEAGLGGVEARFDELEVRFDGLQTRFGVVESKPDTVLELLQAR